MLVPVVPVSCNYCASLRIDTTARQYSALATTTMTLQATHTHTYSMPIHTVHFCTCISELSGEFTMMELANLVKEVVNPKATIVFKENTADDPGKRRWVGWLGSWKGPGDACCRPVIHVSGSSTFLVGGSSDLP
jgi:hypothetical protein